MKIAHNLTLDKEKVDKLKVWLAKRGLTLSGYINAIIDEQLTALEMFSSFEDKKKVTTASLIQLAGKMAKNLTKEMKK